jgi:hypothetical protein
VTPQVRGHRPRLGTVGYDGFPGRGQVEDQLAALLVEPHLPLRAVAGVELA